MTDSLSGDDDHRLAGKLAVEAGALLLEIRRGLDHGEDARALRDAGDRRSHELIVAALRERRPADGLLSEEAVDDRTRLERRRVWIIDPLDGTREFGEIGRDDWTVHVAMCVEGAPIVGAVALPALGLCLSTAEPPPPPPPRVGPPRMVVSRTRPPEWVGPLAAEFGAAIIPMGSAGAKAMAVVRGIAEAYVHHGGQYQWDSAAPVAVALAAGLHASRVDGSPLVYNREDLSVPDLVICRPELADALLGSLAAHLD